MHAIKPKHSHFFLDDVLVIFNLTYCSVIFQLCWKEWRHNCFISLIT